jgi:hypothetical protein
MIALAKDSRLAFRALSRSPGFALMAVATLALAIGDKRALSSARQAMRVDPTEALRSE